MRPLSIHMVIVATMGSAFVSAPMAQESVGACIEDEALRLTVAVKHPSGTVVIERVPTTVWWMEKEYAIDAGIDVLSSVVRNPQSGSQERSAALDRLASLGKHLANRPVMGSLLKVYEKLSTREEKAGVLLCFIVGEDPRGFPLFHEVLMSETDPVVRLFAAEGLAKWNARKGVRELIRLIESSEPLGPRDTGAEAYMLFLRLNDLKGWGAPISIIEEKASAVSAGGAERTYKQAFARECLLWFEVQEDRFPDWKLGDPLPAVEGNGPSKQPTP